MFLLYFISYISLFSRELFLVQFLPIISIGFIILLRFSIFDIVSTSKRMNGNELPLQKFLLDSHDKYFPNLIRIANIDFTAVAMQAVG